MAALRFIVAIQPARLHPKTSHSFRRPSVSYWVVCGTTAIKLGLAEADFLEFK